MFLDLEDNYRLHRVFLAFVVNSAREIGTKDDYRLCCVLSELMLFGEFIARDLC